ncbi:hypothetical protein [Clostridium mediterraneense]|uniref:hypothetical protein n=1 Tax=Clostridium mediterraneense TaxID=1805472 RepID=UPI000829C0C7|nr:hypothetical protein [Clostridium mediterraneense]
MSRSKFTPCDCKMLTEQGRESQQMLFWILIYALTTITNQNSYLMCIHDLLLRNTLDSNNLILRNNLDTNDLILRNSLNNNNLLLNNVLSNSRADNFNSNDNTGFPLSGTILGGTNNNGLS